MSRPNLSPWLTSIPVGEPDEQGERPVVPVALARMTPEERTDFFERFNNVSPETLRAARLLTEARAERDQAIAERDALAAAWPDADLLVMNAPYGALALPFLQKALAWREQVPGRRALRPVPRGSAGRRPPATTPQIRHGGDEPHRLRLVLLAGHGRDWGEPQFLGGAMIFDRGVIALLTAATLGPSEATLARAPEALVRFCSEARQLADLYPWGERRHLRPRMVRAPLRQLAASGDAVQLDDGRWGLMMRETG